MTTPFRALSRTIVCAALFFLIALSLGYQAVSRYTPGPPQLSDAQLYAEMVVEGAPAMSSSGHWRYRVLVPYLSMPVLAVVQGRVGSWNPVGVAVLTVNAAFCAGTALVLMTLAGGGTAGLVAGFLYLAHFNVANLYLSGLVDSSEVFCLTLTAFLLSRGWWRGLPLIFILAATAKETAVPFLALLSGGWWLALPNGERNLGKATIIAVSFCAGLITVLLVQFLVAGLWLWPWQQVQAESTGTPLLANFMALSVRAFLYSFIWILPLGLLGARLPPRPWAVGTACTFAGALGLCVWAGAGDNVGRPLFTAAGPFLISASALWLTRWLEKP